MPIEPAWNSSASSEPWNKYFMEEPMNFRNANESDLKIVSACSLTPVDHTFMEKNRALVVRIEEHNLRLTHAVERLKGSVEYRNRLASKDTRFDAEYGELARDVAYVRQETWGALLGLRVVLQEREVLLKEIFAYVHDQYGTCDLARERAVSVAERRLASERKALHTSNPSTSESHFADLVAEDAVVRKLGSRLNDLRRALESNRSAQQSVQNCLKQLQRRQDEVLAWLIG
jgi:hypothetical protein